MDISLFFLYSILKLSRFQLHREKKMFIFFLFFSVAKIRIIFNFMNILNIFLRKYYYAQKKVNYIKDDSSFYYENIPFRLV